MVTDLPGHHWNKSAVICQVLFIKTSVAFYEIKSSPSVSNNSPDLLKLVHDSIIIISVDLEYVKCVIVEAHHTS